MTLVLGYGVIVGAAAVIQRLSATSTKVHFERNAQGMATWRSGSSGTGAPPRVAYFQIPSAQISIVDSVLDLQMRVTGSTDESSNSASQGLQLQGSGTMRQLPIVLMAKSSGILPFAQSRNLIPLTVAATIGATKLDFRGEASAQSEALQASGSFELQGRSLSEVGDIAL